MTGRGITASQEMRAIRRVTAEADVHTAAAAVVAAQAEWSAASDRLAELEAAEQYESALRWMALLAHWTSSTRHPIRAIPIPRQRRKPPPPSPGRSAKATAQPRERGWFVRPKDRE